MKMAVFNVKMLPFLLVMVLMCSDIVPACTPVPSYRLDFENQDGEVVIGRERTQDGPEDEDEDDDEDDDDEDEAEELEDEDDDDTDDGNMTREKGKEDHGHSSKTSSSRHRNQHGKKTRGHSSKTSSSRHRNQNGMGSRAVQPPRAVFNNPNQPCYTQFFVGGVPPTDLRTGQNLQNISYICQEVNQQTYYGTMFDENLGIAVFSAYKVTQAIFQDFPRPRFRRTPGIQRQGSDAIYQGSDFQKGHLVPFAIYSITQDSSRSTFVYTNAVPQYQPFNGGQWRTYEGKIRSYAPICTQTPQPGTLYLLTGPAFGHITQSKPPQYNPQVPVDQLGPVGNNPAIDIPNLMWTAGCCVFQNGTVRSFAVVGNNLPGTTQLFTQQITVSLLKSFLSADVVNLGIGGRNVDLFPGNVACSNVNNNLETLP